MSNPFQHILNQLLKFSRSDRNALIILSALILIVLIAIAITNNIETKPISNIVEFEKMIKDWEEVNENSIESIQNLFFFDPNTISEKKLDSLSIPVFVKKNLVGFRNAGAKFHSANDLRKVYGMNDSVFNLIEPFVVIKKEIKSITNSKNVNTIEITGFIDPNSAELEELEEFGFNNFQAKNILSYRKKGGVFINVNDLQKIYGIDSLFFETIKNNIQIEKQNVTPVLKQKIAVLDIEINSADSAQFVKLKGIGPVYASRIKYRKLLGGFYSKKQLQEVYNFPLETYLGVEAYLKVDTLLISQIRINFADYKELLRHPYLNKKQVEAILNYRNKTGAIKNISAIRKIEEINDETFLKLKPYFKCR